MIEELWVPVEGFPNYEVSNYGRVVNITRGNDLKPSPDKNGFLRVGLTKNGRVKHFALHRLVAQHFFLNYRDGKEVHFLNDDKTDCTVANITLSKRGCRKSGG